MAEIEPPSFSLGIDLEPEPETEPDPESELFCGLEDEDGIRLRVSDSEPDETGPTLRHLRRGGGPSSSKPISNPIQSNVGQDDDDIEDFSSQKLCPKETDVLLPQQFHSLCSSSKIPLSGCGIFTSEQESDVLTRKRRKVSDCAPRSSADASKGKSLLSDFSASPLRRFRLLDSDSDDPSESVLSDNDTCVDQNEPKGSTKEYCQVTSEKKLKSTPFPEKKDLWKEFYEDKCFSVPTPAFDEFCEEYLNAVKQKGGASGSATEYCSSGPGESMTKKIMQSQDLGSIGPPSHYYFFHRDLRIQNLVHSRLPYFCPLDASGDARRNSSKASAIDYMSQFCHGDGAKQQTGKQVKLGKSSRRFGKKTNKSSLENTSDASKGWINPKQTMNTPKDAGKKRVHANGRSAGHWFTSENGKKVYITGNGQELMGRSAYMRYRKESGKGYKRSKKKVASKKK